MNRSEEVFIPAALRRPQHTPTRDANSSVASNSPEGGTHAQRNNLSSPSEGSTTSSPMKSLGRIGNPVGSLRDHTTRAASLLPVQHFLQSVPAVSRMTSPLSRNKRASVSDSTSKISPSSSASSAAELSVSEDEEALSQPKRTTPATRSPRTRKAAHATAASLVRGISRRSGRFAGAENSTPMSNSRGRARIPSSALNARRKKKDTDEEESEGNDDEAMLDIVEIAEDEEEGDDDKESEKQEEKKQTRARPGRPKRKPVAQLLSSEEELSSNDDDESSVNVSDSNESSSSSESDDGEEEDLAVTSRSARASRAAHKPNTPQKTVRQGAGRASRANSATAGPELNAPTARSTRKTASLPSSQASIDSDTPTTATRPRGRRASSQETAKDGKKASRTSTSATKRVETAPSVRGRKKVSQGRSKKMEVDMEVDGALSESSCDSSSKSSFASEAAAPMSQELLTIPDSQDATVISVLSSTPASQPEPLDTPVPSPPNGGDDSPTPTPSEPPRNARGRPRGRGAGRGRGTGRAAAAARTPSPPASSNDTPAPATTPATAPVSVPRKRGRPPATKPKDATAAAGPNPQQKRKRKLADTPTAVADTHSGEGSDTASVSSKTSAATSDDEGIDDLELARPFRYGSPADSASREIFMYDSATIDGVLYRLGDWVELLYSREREGGNGFFSRFHGRFRKRGRPRLNEQPPSYPRIGRLMAVFTDVEDSEEPFADAMACIAWAISPIELLTHPLPSMGLNELLWTDEYDILPLCMLRRPAKVLPAAEYPRFLATYAQSHTYPGLASPFSPTASMPFQDPSHYTSDSTTGVVYLQDIPHSVWYCRFGVSRPLGALYRVDKSVLYAPIDPFQLSVTLQQALRASLDTTQLMKECVAAVQVFGMAERGVGRMSGSGVLLQRPPTRDAGENQDTKGVAKTTRKELTDSTSNSASTSSLVDPSSNSFQQALASLQLSNVPPSLPCRTEEYKRLYSALHSSLGERGTGQTLYVSGLPGSGKTVTVSRVVRDLQVQVDEGYLPSFVYVEVNAMKLTTPYHIYSILLNALTGDTLPPGRACLALDHYFGVIRGVGTANKKSGAGAEVPAENATSTSSVTMSAVGAPSDAKKQTEAGNSLFAKTKRRGRPRNETTMYRPKSDDPAVLCVVDEFDYCVTKDQSVLYNLFEWPTRPGCKLIVVGIANTMDLPERLLPRVASRLGFNRIVFPTYTATQIEEIMQSRLKDTNVFDPFCFSLIAKRIAMVSGDLRHALEICIRSIEFAQKRFGATKVTVDDVQHAYSDSTLDVRSSKARKLPPIHALTLLCLAHLLVSNGTSSVRLDVLWHNMAHTLRTAVAADLLGAGLSDFAGVGAGLDATDSAVWDDGTIVLDTAGQDQLWSNAHNSLQSASIGPDEPFGSANSATVRLTKPSKDVLAKYRPLATRPLTLETVLSSCHVLQDLRILDLTWPVPAKGGPGPLVAHAAASGPGATPGPIAAFPLLSMRVLPGTIQNLYREDPLAAKIFTK